MEQATIDKKLDKRFKESPFAKAWKEKNAKRKAAIYIQLTVKSKSDG